MKNANHVPRQQPASEVDYVPGVCNIGRQELKMRRFVGWIGLASGLILLIVLIAARASHSVRLALFVPAFVSALGFLQARRGFCVKYGLSGAFNFGDRIGRTTSVAARDDRRNDRRASLAILAQAAVIALVVTIAAYWWP